MKKQLFKFGVNNTKLKNTITFSKSSGLTCPAANKCRAMAFMNEDGKRSVKRFKDTEFTCYSASLEALYPSLYNLTRHNTSLLNEYIKKDDFKGLVECFNVSLNKKRNKNINLVRWNQSGDIYTRFELEALKKVCELNKDLTFYFYSKNLILYPSLYNLTRHNTSLLNEYIKKDDFKGLVECFNVSLNLLTDLLPSAFICAKALHLLADGQVNPLLFENVIVFFNLELFTPNLNNSFFIFN